MPSFGHVFTGRCQELGLSLRAFARKAGLSPGHMNRIANNHESPPLAALPAWADLLGLGGEDRETFIREGRLCHCPPEIVAEYRALRENCQRTITPPL